MKNINLGSLLTTLLGIGLMLVIISSCKKETITNKECNSNFVDVNNECICPIGMYEVVYGGVCVDLNDNQWVAEFDLDYYSVGKIIIEFPEWIENDGFPTSTEIITGKGRKTVWYWEESFSESIDNFDFSRSWNWYSDYRVEAPEGHIHFKGQKDKEGNILNARIETIDSNNVVTSSYPLEFHK